jgi:hypothetical protein
MRALIRVSMLYGSDRDLSGPLFLKVKLGLGMQWPMPSQEFKALTHLTYCTNEQMAISPVLKAFLQCHNTYQIL